MHTHDTDIVKANGGRKRRANSDNIVLFWAGLLSSRSDAKVYWLQVVMGTWFLVLHGILHRFPKSAKL